MHRGAIVEIGDADAICDAPQEAYTRRLLAAVPQAETGATSSLLRWLDRALSR